MSETITAYKSFGDDWTCNGFKYKIGKSYEHEGKVSLCSSGFHACTMPFDCWNYYPRSMNLARVSMADVSADRDDDSKVVAGKITIELSFGLPEWIKAQVAAVIDLCRSAKSNLATGHGGHAAATGDRGHAAATGDCAVAASFGYFGTAMAGESGAIVLAFIKDDGSIGEIRASKVGENGIMAGKTYQLDETGNFIEVEP